MGGIPIVAVARDLPKGDRTGLPFGIVLLLLLTLLLIVEYVGEAGGAIFGWVGEGTLPGIFRA